MLYDILTVALLVGGCLLLWLNLRPRQRDVLLTPKEPVHQEELPGQPLIPVRTELRAEHRAIYEDAPPEPEPVRPIVADPELNTAVDQNSYASHVASAMARVKKPKA